MLSPLGVGDASAPYIVTIWLGRCVLPLSVTIGLDPMVQVNQSSKFFHLDPPIKSEGDKEWIGYHLLTENNVMRLSQLWQNLDIIYHFKLFSYYETNVCLHNDE